MGRNKTDAGQALGRAIRAARVERGFSQERFAAQAGIDRSYYGSIERGEFNVSLETITKLATALETTAAALLTKAGL
ncbi:MAG TPA: helix-turn-helix transcriptional regulator [Solirubrobacteraceae bacterium]|nr:helix-turn-helix transcriptional regulator [Solirubrobacteraceae bacterium]